MEPPLNFDLRLSGSLSAVRVEVIDSPAGQTTRPDALPCTVSADALKDMQDLAPGVDPEAIGRALWRCAFGDREVEGLWRASIVEVGPERILRLRLTIDASDLAALPWELLYDETRSRFLALDAQTSVTRFTRLPISSIPWPQDRPLRLLFTAAAPAEQYTKVHIPRQVVAQEWQAIEQALAPRVKDGRLETTNILTGATRDTLLVALRRGVDIWHYFGHGEESSLLFVDAAGRVAPVTAGELGKVLAGEGVRLVVLNACQAGAGGGQATSVAGEMLRAGVPAVVAMQTKISYDAALAFACAFYDAIAVGQAVDQAMTAGRKAIADTSEWWTPALFMRTPEGRIWREPVKTVETEARARELSYLDGLIEKYGYWAEKYTPLAGIAEVRAAAADGPRLDLPPLFMPTGFEKLEEHGFGEQRRTERVAVDDLREAVAKYKRLVLLGEPGSGKTTTLWRLVYDLAIAAKDDPQAPLPLFVPLGGYFGLESALVYVQQHFEELGPHLTAYLRSKRVVLLLDALNEMPQKDYKDRVGRIHALLDQYSEVSVVVTCRALNYVETLKLEKLEVKLLDQGQQRAYLHRYLGETAGEKLFWQLCGGEEITALWRSWQEAGGMWEQFWTAASIPNVVKISRWSKNAQLWYSLRYGGLPPLLALTRNPFMLVMLAQVYATNKGVLPKNRGRLFAAFVDVLLAREQERCDSTIWPGVATLRLGMSRLAYAMQEAGERGTAVDAEWATMQMAQPDVDAGRLTYLCASATLLDVSDAQVRFVHQLVQEYFAALALAQRLQESDDLHRYLFEDWTRSSGWEETFVLLAGMLPNMTSLIERLLPVNPALAARCIGESGGARPDQETYQKVQERLVGILTSRYAPVVQRNAAGVAINHVGDPTLGAGLRPDGLPEIDWVLIPERDPKTWRQRFIYGSRKKRIEPDFWISRYPITYLQFQSFLDAPDGFGDPQWWKGLAASQEHQASWGDQRFRYWNHPRETVSWYDAIAFCRWITAKAKERPDLLPPGLNRSTDWRITLPTEWQWEKAARAHDGRQYAWGDKYEEGRANIAETRTEVGPNYLHKTSAVGMYPQGASPYGVADSSGNVWEWCLNEYSNPERVQADGDASRVVRGGSWDLNQNSAAAPFRSYGHPDSRDDNLGVRVVVVGFVSDA